MFQYSPNEVALEESHRNLNRKNIERIEQISHKDSLKFILIGDSQRFYEELDLFVAAVNQKPDIDFVILAGDISDFGLQKEFTWVADRLQRLKIPFVSVIGNHDMIANGSKVYKEMFGEDNFSFSCAGNKFVCINTNSLEKNYDGSIPDLPWLKAELTNTTDYHNAFVISHIPPFSEGFDQGKVADYAALLNNSPNIRASLHGHTHSYSISYPYSETIPYVVVGSMNKRSYVEIAVSGEQYNIKQVMY